MKSISGTTLALTFVTLSLAGAGPASADPKTYEWETNGGWLFSEDRDAIEAITGRPSTPVETSAGLRHFVPGSMRGTFIYDAEKTDPPENCRAHHLCHPRAFTNWRSELNSGDIMIGAFTGDAGQVIVSLGDDATGGAEDLVNINMCSDCPGTTGFAANGWRATTSSIVWSGEGFRDNLDLPATLPPPNAPIPMGIFDFHNQALDINASIMSYGLNIRETAQIGYTKPHSTRPSRSFSHSVTSFSTRCGGSGQCDDS